MIDSGPAGEFNRREFMVISAAAVAGATGVTVADAGVEKTQSIEPFSIKVPDSDLRDLRERLGRTRFPDQIESDAWEYGTDLSYLKELCAYWRSEFDWRSQERALNRFSHFRTRIHGLPTGGRLTTRVPSTVSGIALPHRHFTSSITKERFDASGWASLARSP
jgi:hypothetical protein